MVSKSLVTTLLVTLALLCVSCFPKSSASQGAAASTQNVTDVNIDTLFKEAENNAAKAQQLYGNKTIRTTGKILRIFDDSVILGYELQWLYVYFIPSEESKLVNLQKGQMITVRGVYKAEIDGVLRNAVIESNTASSTVSSGANNSGSTKTAQQAPEASASDFAYEWTDDRKGVRIKEYTGRSSVLIIPSTIEGLPVMEIDYLEGIDAVTEIVLPASVTKIERGAFGHRSGGTIGNPIKLKNLTKITLPDGLREIPDYAFEGTSLTTVKLPDSIERIGIEAFAGCKNLKTINLPASLKEIWEEAFRGCSEMNNLIIPDSLSTVQFIVYGRGPDPYNRAFAGCGKLPLATRARIESLGYKGKF
jgi:hypothetical protein